MFCKNCGSEIKEGQGFCSQCGERVIVEAPAAPEAEVQAPLFQQPPSYTQETPPPQPAYSQEPPAAPPQPAYNQYQQTPPPVNTYSGAYAEPARADGGSSKKKLIIFGGIGLVLVAVVVALFFLLGSGGGGEAKNPAAVFYDALGNLLSAKSADLTANFYDDYSDMEISASWIFGDDADDSVADVIIDDGYYLQRLLIFGGDIAMGDMYSDDDIDDPYNYYIDSLYDFADEAGIDLDSIITSKGIDVSSSYEALDELMYEYAEDILDIGGPDLSEADSEGLLLVFKTFFFAKCEDDGIIDEFLTGVKTSTKSGITTYSFTLDIVDMINTFEDYVDDALSDSKFIKKHGLTEANLEVWEWAITMIKPSLRMISSSIPAIEISFSVDKNRIPQSIDIFFELDGEEAGMELDISNYGSSKIDVDAIEELMNDI